ncbi:MAG: ABC transporter ATP-binding protein [Fimbriimonadales bacterium]|nr:ABC transporter ATP-binding protein [Fimbriimonadales bacterium]
MKHLSFTVREGEVVGFLGPNGAGKSSTLKAIMGFVPIAGGTLRVFGRPAGSLEAKRAIGYLPEVALYYPYLTPRETLALYGELQGLRGGLLRAQTAELLERLGLQAVADKQNRNLSKGQLQRVGIAQALLGDPRLLVLDEVTSGLDPVGRRELRGLLQERARAGVTLFFSSHELSEVEMICDRILIVNRGRLVEERSLGELKDQLRIYRLVLEGPALALPDARWVRRPAPGLTEAEFADKRALLVALEHASRAGARVVDLVAEEGSLEDHFVEAIGRAA